MHRISEGNHCQTNEHGERHRDVNVTDAKNTVSKGIHNINTVEFVVLYSKSPLLTSGNAEH